MFGHAGSETPRVTLPDQTLLDRAFRCDETRATEKEMKTTTEFIERREGLGPAAFHETYLERNRPVILTDEVTRWRASERWSDDYLIERFGRYPVDADVHAMHSAHHHVRERTTLGAVLAASRTDPRRFSLVVHVLTRAPYLIPDYSIPRVVAAEEVHSSGFWIKPKLATSGLHFDHQNRLLRGRAWAQAHLAIFTRRARSHVPLPGSRHQ